MAKMIPFSKLKLKAEFEDTAITYQDTEIVVHQALPQEKRAEFIYFVLSNALDDMTGTFSAIRIETYWTIGLFKYYTNISFTEKQIEEAPKTYDLLDTSGLAQMLINALSDQELKFMEQTVKQTAEEIAAYNHSLAGMLSSMNNDASSLNDQVETILYNIKNKEGIEELSAIRNIVGKTE